MFFNRNCNRGKSKIVIQDFVQEVLPDGQTSIKRARNTVNILGSHATSEDIRPSENKQAVFDEDEDCHDIVLGEPGPSHYERSRANAVSHWQNSRKNLIEVSLQREGLSGKQCNRCKAETASIRCLDCGAFLLCENCCILIHTTENILHCPETWKDGKWEKYNIKRKINTSCHDPECETFGRLNGLTLLLIDDKGRHHDVLVPTCSCATVIETLVLHRFWPATPCYPNMAFSFDLLLRLQALMFECHTSVYDFVKHLSFMNNNSPFSKNCNIYEQLRESFEEFRYHCKSIESVPVIRDDDQHLEINLERIKCPSCPDQSENAEDIFLSADACFGLPRKRSAGESYQDPLSSDCYFLDQNEVDHFINEYPAARSKNKSDAIKDREEDCCSNFQAGSVIRSKGRYIALDETAVFGMACRHAIPWKFLNLKGGERLGYMVYMMKKVVNDENFSNNNIKLMYDICCQLDKHLKNQGQADLLERVDLGCPQFHAYAHGADCQVLYSPRRLPGWGLCDGEVMERLWSYLGKFKKMTKEMSSIHRQDILTDALHFYALHQKKTLVTSIVNRHKNAMKIQRESLETIKEIQEDYSSVISHETIQKWLEDERKKLMEKNVPKASFQGHEWMIEYFTLLRKFYALRENLILNDDDDTREKQMGKLVKQLVAFENAHNIPVRWKQTDQLYQNALITNEAASAKTSLGLLRMSGRRRWFLLSLVKKYADGQAQAYRIIKAIANESSKLKKLLKKFNASVQILKEHGKSVCTLSWEQVTNVSGSSLYAGTEQADHTLVPDAIKRELVDAYALCQRAGEELTIVYQEMSRVIVHYCEECKAMEASLQKIPEVSNLLWAGLKSVILRKIDFCLSSLLFAVNSFKPFIEVSPDVEDYLENNNRVISSNQLLNDDEADEADITEDASCPISSSLEYAIDEKNDYLFRDDEDSGFFSAGEFSMLS